MGWGHDQAGSKLPIPSPSPPPPQLFDPCPLREILSEEKKDPPPHFHGGLDKRRKGQILKYQSILCLSSAQLCVFSVFGVTFPTLLFSFASVLIHHTSISSYHPPRHHSSTNSTLESRSIPYELRHRTDDIGNLSTRPEIIPTTTII